MKKQYTKKQIQEAITYWEKQLRTGNYRKVNEAAGDAVSFDDIVKMAEEHEMYDIEIEEFSSDGTKIGDSEFYPNSMFQSPAQSGGLKRRMAKAVETHARIDGGNSVIDVQIIY